MSDARQHPPHSSSTPHQTHPIRGLAPGGLVTDLQRQVTELREENFRTETILRGLGVGLVEWPDLRTRDIAPRDSFYAFLGHAPAGQFATVDDLRDLVEPSDLDGLIACGEEAVAAMGRCSCEVRLCFSDREYRWTEVSVLASETLTGRVSLTAALRDIHEAHRERNHYARLSERLGIVVDSYLQGVWDWPDSSENFIVVSRSMRRLLGYADEEVESDVTWFWSVIHPDDHASAEAALQEAFAESAHFEVEYRIRFKDRGYRWVRSVGTAVPLGGGRHRLTGAIQDIHDQREAERALRAANAQLERFTHVVAHDLSSPLYSIEGFSQVLLEDYAEVLGADGNYVTGAIKASVRELRQIVKDLLEYSRLGTAALKFVPVDLGALVARLREVVDPHATVNWDVGDLPTVTGDATQLRLLLQNLLANAVKFSARRGTDAEIGVSAEAQGEGRVCLRVADNGVGFEPGLADKIFRPFERGHRRDQFEGTGIGLAHVAQIAARHRGRVRAESVVGEGATFYVELPTSLPPTGHEVEEVA